MIGLIRRKRYQIDTFGYGDIESVLKYGTYYSSRESTSEQGFRNNFILMFKRAVVRIDSYDMRSPISAVFPMKWYLQVSNDNKTWLNISVNDEPLCKETFYPNPSKKHCNGTQERRYDVLNSYGYFSFVKFVLIKNSIISSNEAWLDRIAFTGFELNGDYYLKHDCLCSKQYSHGFKLYYSLLISLSIS